MDEKRKIIMLKENVLNPSESSCTFFYVIERITPSTFRIICKCESMDDAAVRLAGKVFSSDEKDRLSRYFIKRVTLSFGVSLSMDRMLQYDVLKELFDIHDLDELSSLY